MDKLPEWNQSDIYRYLGYRPNQHVLTEDIRQMIEKQKETVLKVAEPKWTATEKLPLTRTQEGIAAQGILLTGSDIERHLRDCTHVILLAATLGNSIDALLRKTEVTDVTGAVILDAVANVAIEALAQQAEDALRASCAKEQLYLTGRYSPGYGDLPLSLQGNLLRYTDAARKIGLHISESYLMVPRKSITAIAGVAPIPVKGYLAGCGHCVLQKNCEFRKRGTNCVVSDSSR